MSEEQKPKVHIESWTIVGSTLYGSVQDHPRFDKGAPVRTSSILVQPTDPKEGDEIETRNTVYILGKEHSNAA